MVTPWQYGGFLALSKTACYYWGVFALLSCPLPSALLISVNSDISKSKLKKKKNWHPPQRPPYLHLGLLCSGQENQGRGQELQHQPNPPMASDQGGMPPPAGTLDHVGIDQVSHHIDHSNDHVPHHIGISSSLDASTIGTATQQQLLRQFGHLAQALDPSQLQSVQFGTEAGDPNHGITGMSSLFSYVFGVFPFSCCLFLCIQRCVNLL